MPRTLRCPQGHEWDAPPDDTVAECSLATCPTCGAPSGSMPAEEMPEFGDELPPPPRLLSRPALVSPTAAGEPGGAPTVPGYEVLSELGRGGMGVVYKAQHLRLDRPVALKVVLAGAFADPEGVARFRTEAETVARLQHPNIVQIHEV